MAVLIRKFYHLVLYRRTVSGSRPFNRTGKQRGTVKIGPDNLMGLLAGIRKPAGYLILLDGFRIRGKGKRYDFLITELLFHLGKIDAPLIHSRRGSRLKTVHLDPMCLQ